MTIRKIRAVTQIAARPIARAPELRSAAGDQQGASTRYQSALADFSKAIELSPKDASLYQERAETEIELKEYDAALADLNKALELKPDDLNAIKFRGFAEIGLNQWDKAVADFSAVIQKKPDDLQSYDRRALAYRSLKNYDASIADYTFLITKNPNDLEALTKRGYTVQPGAAVRKRDCGLPGGVKDQSAGQRHLPALAICAVNAGGKERDAFSHASHCKPNA